jgi:hypothetical protein
MITNIETYEENGLWYVKYTHNEIEKLSEGFNTKEEAIKFELNLKFI